MESAALGTLVFLFGWDKIILFANILQFKSNCKNITPSLCIPINLNQTAILIKNNKKKVNNN